MIKLLPSYPIVGELQAISLYLDSKVLDMELFLWLKWGHEI